MTIRTSRCSHFFTALWLAAASSTALPAQEAAQAAAAAPGQNAGTRTLTPTELEADVPLYLLYVGINGDYQIAGVPRSKGTGDSPWPPSAVASLAEEATLVVIYRHPGNTFTKTYVYEASMQQFGASTFLGRFDFGRTMRCCGYSTLLHRFVCTTKIVPLSEQCECLRDFFGDPVIICRPLVSFFD